MPNTNYNLTQDEKDKANETINQMVDSGASDVEIQQFKDNYVAEVEAGKQEASGPTGDPGSSDSQPDDISSESVGADDWGSFVTKANGKRYYADHTGEINAIAGEAGQFINHIPYFGDVIDDIYGAFKTGRAQARSVDDALNLFKEGADVSDEDLQEYMARAKELEGARVSDEAKAFNQAYEDAGGGALGFVKAIATNPQTAGETIISSLVAMANPASAAGAGVGAGTGAVTGSIVPGIGTGIGAVSGAMAGASGTLDTALSFTEFLQEEVSKKGLDFDDEGIRAVLEDPKALSRVRTRSASRGAVVGLVDGLTGGIAGKITKAGAAIGKSAAKAGAKGFVVEAAGGGLGETGGRLVAGQELDAREIGLEIIGEIGGGAPVIKQALNEAKAEKAAKPQIEGNTFEENEFSEFVDSATDEEVILSDIQPGSDPETTAKFVKRKYGFDYGKDAEVLTPEESSARQDIKAEIDDLSNIAKTASPEAKAALLDDAYTLQGEMKDLVKEQRKRISKITPKEREAILQHSAVIQNSGTIIKELENSRTEENGASVDKAIKRQQEKIDASQEEVDTISANSIQKKEAADAEVIAQEEEAARVAEEEELAADPRAAQIKEAKEEIINEDIQDGEKAIEGTLDQLEEFNVFDESNYSGAANTDIDGFAPIGKKGKSLVEGDFVKKVSGHVPTEPDYKRAKRVLENEAKKNGWEVQFTDEGQIDENGQPLFEAEIRRPREESLNSQVESAVPQPEAPAETEQEVNPQGNVVGEKVDVDEKGPVKKRKARSKTEQEAPTAEFVNDKRYPGVKEIGPDTFELGDPKQIHKLRNDVAGRNYEVQENSDGTVTLTPGKPSFSLDESQIPSITDQIKAENPGKITHQKARRLATERLREGVREVDRVKGLTPDAEDGATFNTDGTKYEGGGLVVPVTSENLTQAELTPERIQAFKDKHKDKIGPATKVGIYKFPNSDKVSIDLNIVAPSSQRERALAIGKELGQESLFDLDTFENVKTGETGQAPKQITAEQAKQFADELVASPEFSLADRPLTKLLSPEEKKARRLEEQKEAQPPKKASDPAEKFEAIARIKPPTLPTPFAPPGTPAKGPVLQNPGVELRKTAEGEELADAFDRALVSGDPAATLREDLGKQPNVDDAFINAYNEGKLTNEDLIKSLANYVMGKAPRDKEVQGFALGKFVEEVIGGKFKDKNVRQVFSKAKSIASRAKTLQREAYGENRDYQRSRNVARRAEQAFYAEHGRDPGYDELADYINENKNKYKIDITPAQVEEAFVEEVNIEQPGVQGEVRERAQDRAAREAGLDTVSGEVLNPETQDVVDTIVEGLVAQRPEIESEGKFQNLQPRKGASLKRAAEGDVAGKKVKTINTKIDQDIKNEIGKVVKGDQVSKAFAKFGKEFGFGDANYNSLDRAEKQKFRRRLIDGLAYEAEQRVGEGKPTPSPEFSLENRNPKFSGFEFDAGRTTSQRVQGAVTPFLRNSKQRLRGDKFSSILTHRSPEKKAAVKRAAREVGANVVDHPLNPGEVLVLAPGKTLSDVLKFNTSKNGKAIDLDPRDFTTFNEDSKPDARQYTNLNINDLINNINSRGQYINNISNWGKLNKIAQLQPNDINNIKRSLTEQGFNVEESVDAKGDPTIVFSKGRINPQWSLKDVHAPSKEQASPEYIKSVSKALQSAFPNVDVISSQEGFNNAVNELQRAGHYLPAGVKGMQYANKVVINPSIATKDTPIHEFGHIWASQLQKTNPKLWKRGVELLKGSPYMRVVADIPHYKAYLKESPSKFYEEVMANALGKRGAEIFARNTEKAGAWDNFMNKVGSWLKDKLNIASEKDYADLTLDDWLNIGASSILTGDQTAFNPVANKPAAQVEYSLSEDPNTDPDVVEAKLEGRLADKKRGLFERLVPPAADDYHGLVSKLGDIAKTVTDAFVNDHQNYVQRATKVRSQIKDARKALKDAGIELGKEKIAKIGKTDVTAAQAIQAHVDGRPSEFTGRPAVQKYINTMRGMGVLKPSSANRDWSMASPDFDTVDYIVNDLYKESFKNFVAEKNKVFNPAKLAQIRAEKGNKFADALEGSLNRMTSGKNTAGISDPTTAKWNNWVLGSVGNIMFLNFRSAALQLLSVGNFGFSAKNPGAFVANFFNPNTYSEAKKLFNSGYLKERRARAGFDVNANEMIDMVNSSTSFGDLTKKILNFGFVATSMVDSVAIAMGGAAYIDAQVKAGVPRSEAIKAWKELTEEAQQSSRPDRVSQWQSAGVSKFVLAFANTPQQYFRLSQKAFRSIKEGKDVGRNLAKIGYYMAAQNAIFTGLQSASMAMLGLDAEDEEGTKALDQYNSMLGTVLRGMGLYGAVIDAVKNVVVQGYKEDKKSNPDHVATLLKATSISPPINRKVQDLQAIGRAYKFDSPDKHVTAIARGTALTTNLPADWVQKKGTAVYDLWSEDYAAWQKIMMLAGWSKWNFSKKDEGDFNFDDLDFDDIDFDDVDFDDFD